MQDDAQATSCSRTAPSSAGRSVGAAGVAAGEACFTTAMRRLRGGGHRPELRRAGALLRLSADRQLRRRPSRASSPSRVQAKASSCATRAPGVGGWLREQGVVALDDVDTRALVRRIRADGVAALRASATAPVEELHARALAEPPIDGRPLDRPSARRSRTPSAPGRASSLVDLGCKRSIPRAARRRPGSRSHVVPGDWDADAILELQPRAVLIGNGPGDPAVLDGPDRDGPRPARARAALRHLPRPPAARPRARPRRRSSSRSATAARTIRCATPRTGRVLVTVQNHGFAVAAPTSDVSHVSLNDGTVRGARRRGLRERPVPSRGRARARSTRFPSSTGSPRHAEAHRPSLDPDPRLRADPHRPGVRVRLLGAQACRVLRREGYRVVLVNSNPATIMTDPEWADATYLEPLDARDGRRGDRARAARRAPADARRPDRAQPRGRAARGRRARAVRRRADRRRPSTRSAAPRTGELFREAMVAAGLPVPRVRSSSTSPRSDGSRCPRSCGRRSRSAARGGGIARTPEELAARIAHGLAASPVGQVLVEESLAGLAGARARGDVRLARATASSSARSRTSTRWACTPATRGRSRRSRRCPTREYQRLREAAFACARAVGVATGGANVQFAYEPRDARAARDRDEPARLALVGARVEGDRLPDREARRAARGRLHARRAAERHHRQTTAAFEPALDYVAVKAPRFDFEKFPAADAGSAARCAPSARRSGSAARSRRRS